MANKSLNRVVLMGNLTRDPELKYTPTGTAVCTIGLATNRTWTTGTGELKEEVQFHRIIAWQKLAELCAKLLIKGRKVYLEGRLVYRSYTAKDGQLKQITEIIMSDFILFDDKSAKGTTEADVPATETMDNSESSPDYSIDVDLDSLSATTAEARPQTEPSKESLVKEDDDIPF